ncbi:hypothetical protein HanPI659440_Chr05g0213591 [Helianthus annuus]|nr:hypothetical protein HanPI659440_Chr05g0213591 [Helianthus annuus]
MNIWYRVPVPYRYQTVPGIFGTDTGTHFPLFLVPVFMGKIPVNTDTEPVYSVPVPIFPFFGTKRIPCSSLI